MDIKYLGHASFILKKKRGIAVVTDPFSTLSVGLKYPKVEAQIVTVSHDHEDHSASEEVKGDPLVINLPGEYESHTVVITGYPTFHDKTKGQERGGNIVFKIEMDDISVMHCGDLGHTLSDELIEAMGDVDILMVPVGGFYTIDAKDALGVIKEIEPSIVIPMHYAVDGMKAELKEKLSPVEDFLRVSDAGSVDTLDKLSVKKGDLGEEMKVVVMGKK